MSKRQKVVIYIVLVIFLPTLFVILIDWLDVKTKMEINDKLWNMWHVVFIISIPLLFIGIQKLLNKKIFSLIITILAQPLLYIFDIIFSVFFYFLIGGQK
jgi:hypothetical protein